LLALFSRAILLILYAGIAWYRLETVPAGNCWNHCEYLSKLKDADFQQLNINKFYLITIPGFYSKEARSISCKFLVEDGNKKTDIPAY